MGAPPYLMTIVFFPKTFGYKEDPHWGTEAIFLACFLSTDKTKKTPKLGLTSERVFLKLFF
ncbi:MAG: hypothetical protein Ct9H300mP3_09680 [Gammaproteobacteria bacterium]|nr:MAG: hypothetical protein Ct9H300mP3_09680 [Gammaproteobacteria bacterium]